MKMSNFERKYSYGYHLMICVGEKNDKQKMSIQAESI